MLIAEEGHHSQAHIVVVEVGYILAVGSRSAGSQRTAEGGSHSEAAHHCSLGRDRSSWQETVWMMVQFEGCSRVLKGNNVLG